MSSEEPKAPATTAAGKLDRWGGLQPATARIQLPASIGAWQWLPAGFAKLTGPGGAELRAAAAAERVEATEGVEL